MSGPAAGPDVGPAVAPSRTGARSFSRATAWLPVAALVLAEIGYPLTHGRARAALTVLTVCLGYLASTWHAFTTRGARTGLTLVAITTGGGLAVEIVGVSTGFPFGRYAYSSALGPHLASAPLVIPLAWTWMAWPAWLAAARLCEGGPARVAVAALGLTGWDLFLDPQMVAEGYWRWAHPSPGIAGVPLTNYIGWLAVALAMAALFAGVSSLAPGRDDTPMLALYLWTYASLALAHAVFLNLPVSALSGAVGMGSVAVPLAIRLARR